MEINYFEGEIFNQGSLNLLIKEEFEFIDCTFESIDFSSACFKRCKFIECAFIGCNISNVKIDFATFRDVKFNECKLIGINWSTTQNLSDLSFNNSKMEYNVFCGLKLSFSKFINCGLKGSDFSTGDFKNCFFVESDLYECSFVNSNLESANFTGARNYFIDIKHTNVKKATFSLPEAISLLEHQEIKII